MTNYSRRQFLGALGAGTLAAGALARPGTAREAPVVKMGNNYFEPIGLRVEPGTTVRFEVAAGAHSATAYENRIPSDATAFNSGVISAGGFEYTFEDPGTYDYYCVPHKSDGMVGRIVAGSPAGPAEERPVPDGTVPESDAILAQAAIVDGGNTGGDDGSFHGGMMGSGPGMGGGRDGGWGSELPFVGGVLGILGLVGGLLYWALGRDGVPPDRDDPAMDTLKRRYAQGEIDEEEFQQRREWLEDERNGSSP